MKITGRLIERVAATNCPYVGSEASSFDTQSVDQWGVLSGYGDRRTFLVASVYGYEVAVIMSQLGDEAKKEMTAIRKMLKISRLEQSRIRTSRQSGIVWHNGEIVYVP